MAKIEAQREWLEIDNAPQADRVRVSICDETTEKNTGEPADSFVTLSAQAAYEAAILLLNKSMEARDVDLVVGAIVWMTVPGEKLETVETAAEDIDFDPESLS